ncbi:MAG: hypothetical protein QM681_11965 [Novosphingobium sp.]
MTAQVIAFPDRPAILIDKFPMGEGYEVEPHRCPAASGKGRWYPTFVEAHDYAEELARQAGTSVFVMCDVPEGDAA